MKSIYRNLTRSEHDMIFAIFRDYLISLDHIRNLSERDPNISSCKLCENNLQKHGIWDAALTMLGIRLHSDSSRSWIASLAYNVILPRGGDIDKLTWTFIRELLRERDKQDALSRIEKRRSQDAKGGKVVQFPRRGQRTLKTSKIDSEDDIPQ